LTEPLGKRLKTAARLGFEAYHERNVIHFSAFDAALRLSCGAHSGLDLP